jgi:hypothetical protein
MSREDVTITNATQHQKTVNLARKTTRLCSAVAGNQLRLDCSSVGASQKWNWNLSGIVLLMEVSFN